MSLNKLKEILESHGMVIPPIRLWPPDKKNDDGYYVPSENFEIPAEMRVWAEPIIKIFVEKLEIILDKNPHLVGAFIKHGGEFWFGQNIHKFPASSCYISKYDKVDPIKERLVVPSYVVYFTDNIALEGNVVAHELAHHYDKGAIESRYRSDSFFAKMFYCDFNFHPDGLAQRMSDTIQQRKYRKDENPFLDECFVVLCEFLWGCNDVPSSAILEAYAELIQCDIRYQSSLERPSWETGEDVVRSKVAELVPDVTNREIRLCVQLREAREKSGDDFQPPVLATCNRRVVDDAIRAIERHHVGYIMSKVTEIKRELEDNPFEATVDKTKRSFRERL